MSSASSSKRKDDLLWALTAFKEIRYYVWTLTLCRIGHKPRSILTKNPSTGMCKNTLSCSRCERVLKIDTIGNHSPRRDSATKHT